MGACSNDLSTQERTQRESQIADLKKKLTSNGLLSDGLNKIMDAYLHADCRMSEAYEKPLIDVLSKLAKGNASRESKTVVDDAVARFAKTGHIVGAFDGLISDLTRATVHSAPALPAVR